MARKAPNDLGREGQHVSSNIKIQSLKYIPYSIIYLSTACIVHYKLVDHVKRIFHFRVAYPSSLSILLSSLYFSSSSQDIG